jgi:hypothetical protein
MDAFQYQFSKGTLRPAAAMAEKPQQKPGLVWSEEAPHWLTVVFGQRHTS